MSNGPYRRLEQAFEEYRKVFEEYDDLVRRIREAITEDEAILKQHTISGCLKSSSDVS